MLRTKFPVYQRTTQIMKFHTSVQELSMFNRTCFKFYLHTYTANVRIHIYHSQIQFKLNNVKNNIYKLEGPHTEYPEVSISYESSIGSTFVGRPTRERLVAPPLAVLAVFDGAY